MRISDWSSDVCSSDLLPAIKGWRTRATTDEATIRQWWAARPYNVGVATGYPVPYGGYLMVVDLDMKKGKDGRLSLALLELEHGPLATTFTVVTPTLGRHLYFATATPLSRSIQHAGKDIGIRGVGGNGVGPGRTIKTQH